MKLLILAFLISFAACGDNSAIATAPDAGAVDCCSFYPDVAAVSACVLAPGAAAACGGGHHFHQHCELADGSSVDVAVCSVLVDGGAP